MGKYSFSKLEEYPENDDENVLSQRHIGPLSHVTVGWMKDIIRLGNKQPLENYDLFASDDLLTSKEVVEKLEEQWHMELKSSKSSNTRPKLWRGLIRMHSFKSYFMIIALNITFLFSSILQAVCLSFILSHLMVMGMEDAWVLYLYIVGIVLLTMLMSVAQNIYTSNTKHLNINFRTGLMGVVYKKVQTMSAYSLASITSGSVINLVSKDLEPIDHLCFLTPYLVTVPLHVTSVTFLLWWLVGLPAVISIAYTVFLIALQMMMGRILQTIRVDTMQLTDKRVHLLSDMISGIRILKSNVWEHIFSNRIQCVRSGEIRLLRLTGFVVASLQASVNIYTIVSAMPVFLLLMYVGEKLTPQNVFTVVALLGTTQSLSQFFTAALTTLSRCKPSLERIQNFLIQESLVNYQHHSFLVKVTKEGSADENTFPSTLEKSSRFNIQERFQQTKSSCEAPKESEAEFEDLQSGIVERNTTSEEQLNKTTEADSKSSESSSVILSSVTCQWEDSSSKGPLKNVSLDLHGNKLSFITGAIGSGKSSLLHVIMGEMPVTSGKVAVKGKIAFISQTPWIFSGTVRDNILFGKKFNEERYWKVIDACALEGDLENLPQGDLTELGERGVSLSGGQQARVSLARAVYLDADIYLMDDPLSAVDSKVGRHIMDRCILGILSNSLRIVVTHRMQYVRDSDHIVVLENGFVVSNDTCHNLKTDRYFQSFLSQDQETVPTESNSERIVMKKCQSSSTGLNPIDEDRVVGSVSWKTYWSYLKAGIVPVAIALLAIVLILQGGAAAALNLWLATWAKMSSNEQRNSTSVEFYIVLTAANVILTLIATLSLINVTVRSSKHLHQKMVSAVIRSPVRFFDTNPTGQILNRFTQDMAQIDDTLSFELLGSTLLAVQLLGNLTVICIANPWLVLAVVPYLVCSKRLHSYHLCAARELKRLEVMNGSPLYDQFADTIRGIVTIRNQRQEKAMVNRLFRCQELWNQACYLFQMSYRWAYFRLDVLCALVVAVISFSTLWSSTSAALTGLMISQALSFLTTFRQFLFKSSVLESKMISVERVLSYTLLEPEAGYEIDVHPHKSWPESGCITAKDVSLVYYPGGPRVLHGLCFTISPGEKVGIVGRTGAGKSSVVAALCRMPNPQGQVIIDGIDINSVNVESARAALAVIPQNPFLFNGSLRDNLDPGNLSSDEEIWAVLEQVRLKNLLQVRSNGSDQLHLSVTENGANFSVGERQLICLARVLLRDTRIVVLDEATASVDYKTDQILQRVIRSELQGRTVLTIAHRIDTVLDYDRIMVIDNGRVVEIDGPEILLQDKDSYFTQMVKKCGNNTD